MQIDFQNPHTLYVLAAYGVAFIAYLALTLHTFLTYRNITRK
ncbi:MAG: heme exporter protein CcmD [Alphaproteobacteria bacterium]|nr:heme exporter protein CcmD [Alphaproteobacteria bacterium]